MSENSKGMKGNDSQIISRRKALKAVGISGAAVTTVPTLVGATKNSSHDDTVRITTVKVGDEPRVQKEVPADWWFYEQKADRIRSELENQYADVQGIYGVSLGTSKETISGRRKSALTVRVDPDSYDAVIPDHVDGVEVTIEKATETELMYDCSDDTSAHEYVPGGVSLTDDPALDANVTSTCEVTYSGTHYLMTCAHQWDCDTSAEGASVYQADQKVGEVYREKKNQDWVIVEKTSDSEISGFSHYIENDDDPLCGHVTRDGLIDLKGAGTTVYQQGIATCRTNHTVMDVDCNYSGCYLNDGRTVRLGWNTDSDQTEKGDSGGPFFHNYYYNGSYYNAIICPLTGNDTGNNASIGTAAYWIHSDQLIDFNPADCTNKYT